ncbi:MAG: hypothetical protein DI587_11140 [Variovorax paradoxus]|nr:MAG: hypothetical protein DI583_11140 [Variovorax paradoxus]PZQ11005.1 MAG: hypothetical protein DI587_11140 [Variovorax paradoxus]
MVATLSHHVLVRTTTSRPAATRAEDSARVLLARAGRALLMPGLSRTSVFTGPPDVRAYSVDPDDLTRLIEETEDGSRRVGRFVDGRFVALAG